MKQLDAVLFSNGIQRDMDFKNPDSIDLEGTRRSLCFHWWFLLSISALVEISLEVTTNYTSVVALIKFLLPHFMARNVSFRDVLTSFAI